MTRALEDKWDCDFVVYSRDEQKQAAIARRFPNARCVLGDIRDTARLSLVCANLDFVIHTAALKYIPEAEKNVQETIDINVKGSESVLRACMGVVPLVVGISTDKAPQPLNTYGATKMLMERLFVEYDQYREGSGTACVTVRYGNVIASTGSIVPVFKQQVAAHNRITITDPEMTRYWLDIDEAVDLILHAADTQPKQAVVIPNSRGLSVGSLADILFDGVKRDVTGRRPGEKLHETLLTAYEGIRAYTDDEGYVIYNPVGTAAFHMDEMSSQDAPPIEDADLIEAVERAESI